MQITTKNINGEHVAAVKEGDRIVYVTAEYITERMALADARCWVAFHASTPAALFFNVKHSIETSEGAVELTQAEAMRVFARVEAWRMSRRSRENFQAARLLRAFREDYAGRITWTQGKEISTWYMREVYNPAKPWTCPF